MVFWRTYLRVEWFGRVFFFRGEVSLIWVIFCLRFLTSCVEVKILFEGGGSIYRGSVKLFVGNWGLGVQNDWSIVDSTRKVEIDNKIGWNFWKYGAMLFYTFSFVVFKYFNGIGSQIFHLKYPSFNKIDMFSRSCILLIDFVIEKHHRNWVIEVLIF